MNEIFKTMGSMLLSNVGTMNTKIKEYLRMLQRGHVCFDNMEHVDINTVSFMGPPLHFALGDNDFELVKLLLDNGADPDLKDSDGYTTLDQAVEFKNKKMVSLLLEYGAKLSIMDENDLIEIMS